jgi:RES domain-containing protein
MLRVRYQTDPLSGEGAKLHGGRWNRRGQAALYMSADIPAAVAEYHRGLPFPGTLVGLDVSASQIVDLTDGAGQPLNEEVGRAARENWNDRVRIGLEPLSWSLANRLIERADGALVPSFQMPGGTNLVLWRWSADGSDGARVRVVDPHGDLPAA